MHRLTRKNCLNFKAKECEQNHALGVIEKHGICCKLNRICKSSPFYILLNYIVNAIFIFVRVCRGNIVELAVTVESFVCFSEKLHIKYATFPIATFPL